MRFNYLDGLRGSAAVFVYLVHFLLGFDASILTYMSDKNSYLDILINKPALFLLNGPLLIKIFFVHSGFVLTHSLVFYEKPLKDIFKLIIRRYVRLTIPMAASIMLAYILLKNHLLFNQSYGIETQNSWLKMFYKFDADIFEAIKQSLYQTYFQYKTATSYNSVLWTIGSEFYGSIFIFVVVLIFNHFKIKFKWISILLLYPLSFGLNSFVWGILLYYFYTEKILHKFKSNYWNLLIPVVLYFGYFNTWPIQDMTAAIIISVFLLSEKTQLLFDRKIFHWLGKISYSLYLIHLPIYYSLGIYLYQKFGFTVSFFITTLVTFTLADLMSRLIDQPSIKLSRKLF